MQAGTLTMPASTRKGEATNERRYYATLASVAEGPCPRRGGQSRPGMSFTAAAMPTRACLH